METNTYPANFDEFTEQDRIDKAAVLSSNAVAINAAMIIFINDDVIREIEKRIIKNCELLSDIDEVDMPEFYELRKIGIELYDLGGYLLMKQVCDSLAKSFADSKKRTRKGNSYLIGSLCNAAWNNIGEWVH